MEPACSIFIQIFTRPLTAGERLRTENVNWVLPAALFLTASVSSALLAGRVPPDFLADLAGGGTIPRGGGFFTSLPVCLSGTFGFTAFFSALLCGFAPFLNKGRLARRLPSLLLVPLAYGFFFLLPLKAHLFFRAAQWLLAAAAASFAAGAAWRGRARYAPLMQIMLILSLLTLASDALSWGAVLAGSIPVYTGGQYLFAFVSLVYIARAAAGLFEVPVARAAVAAVAAMLGAAVFVYSLMALGLLSADTFQALMLT